MTADQPATETTMPLDLDTLTLDHGSHRNPDDGVCLMEGCIEWGGRRNDDGYGLVGKKSKAHRLAWEQAHGPIPGGLHVLHHCDNPPCVNVDHLFLGTNADNVADRHAKGRTVMPTNGPDFWRAKTHCPQGHPYSGDNVRYRPDGHRRCAACYRERTANRRALQKVSA